MAREKRNIHLSKLISSILILVVSFVILAVSIAAATSPNRYDIRAGMVSPVTITATKDVVDTVTTNALREAAAADVEPSYVQDSSVAPQVLGDITTAFQAFIALGYPADGAAPTEITPDLRTAAAETIAPASLSDARIDALLSTGRTTLAELAQQTQSRTREYLNLNIAEGQVPETIRTVQRELVSAGWSSALAGAATDILKPYLRANMVIDSEITEANRQTARETVEDVVYIKGQNIVRTGELVTRAQIEMLNSMGLLKEQGLDISLISGVSILAAIFLGMLTLYLATFEKELLYTPMSVALLMSILVVTVLISWAVRQLNAYLMPTVLGVMLTVYLMKPRLALMAGIVLAVLAGLIASGASGIFTAAVFGTILTTVVSSALCISVITRSSTRSAVLVSGLLCGLGSMLTSIAIGLTNNANLQIVLQTSCWSAGSGVLAGVLCIGLQPILENVFNLTTSARLFDLTNPNQPLLRRLLMEAPGTYHHSIVVANLAEAAANAIGANGLLARVGSYYHDVGKLKRPLYFKENQMGDNPHDRTDPRVSAAIILAHTQDGALLAAKERIPEPVRNIIARHHGHSSVLYFYDKALKQAGGEGVDVSDFTYTEPLPQTREEAIVMLADPVEAAARVLKDRDPQSMGAMIDKLIESRINNGDMNDCQLTFHDIARIREAFVTVLTGVYHERIEYPDAPAKRGKNDEEGKARGVAQRFFPRSAHTAATETKPADAKPEEQKPAKAKPAQAKPVEPKPTEQKPVEPKPVEPKPTEHKPAEPKPTEHKPAEPKPVEPKPTEQKTVEPKPTEHKPAEPKPVEPKPTEHKPAEPKPVEPKPAEHKPAEPKPVEPKPAEQKTVEPKPDTATTADGQRMESDKETQQ